MSYAPIIEERDQLRREVEELCKEIERLKGEGDQGIIDGLWKVKNYEELDRYLDEHDSIELRRNPDWIRALQAARKQIHDLVHDEKVRIQDLVNQIDARELSIREERVKLREKNLKFQEEQQEPKNQEGEMKIIQILFSPNDSQWQGVLLGLGDDGLVYRLMPEGWSSYTGHSDQPKDAKSGKNTEQS